MKIGPIELPLGLPILWNLPLPAMPASGTQCFPFSLANNPALIGFTFHLTVVFPTVSPGPTFEPGLIEFTPRFDIRVLPPL